jgi:hypothetical protein
MNYLSKKEKRKKLFKDAWNPKMFWAKEDSSTIALSLSLQI